MKEFLVHLKSFYCHNLGGLKMRYVDFVQPHVSTLAHVLNIHLKCDSKRA